MHKSNSIATVRMLVLLIIISVVGSAISQPMFISGSSYSVKTDDKTGELSAEDSPLNSAKIWQERYFVGSDILQKAHHQASALPKSSVLPSIAVKQNGKSPSVSVVQASVPSSTWHELGPNPLQPIGQGPATGRLSAIAVDPTNSQIIYVGAASGGIWKTTDGGGTWIPETDFQNTLAISALAIDPTNSSIIYAGTGDYDLGYFQGDGVLRSLDGGTTWLLLPNSEGPVSPTPTAGAYPYIGAISKIIVNPRDHTEIFVAGVRGLFKIDQATDPNLNITVQQLTTGLPPCAPVTAPSNSCVDSLALDAKSDPSTDPNKLVLYLTMRPANANASGLYKSTDSGTDWSQVSVLGVTTWAHGSIVAVAPSNPRILYLAVVAADNQKVFVPTPLPSQTPYATPYNGVYYSQNQGASWSNVTNLIDFDSVGMYTLKLAVDPVHDDVLYLGGTEGIVSLDARGQSCTGGSWFQYTHIISPGITVTPSIHVDLHALEFASCPVTSGSACPLRVGTDGGIYSVDLNSSLPTITSTPTNTFTPTPTSTATLNPLTPTLTPTFVPGTPTPTLPPCGTPNVPKIQNLVGNLNVNQFWGGDIHSDFSSVPLAVGGLQDNGLYSHNGISNSQWNFLVGGDGGHVVIDPSNSNIIYAGGTGGPIGGGQYDDGFIKSSDGGLTWNKADWGLVGDGLTDFFQIDHSNTNHLVFSAAGNNRIYESITGAEPLLAHNATGTPTGTPAWYQSNANTFSTFITAVSISPLDGKVVYVGLNNGEIWKRSNADSGASDNFAQIAVAGSDIAPNSSITQIVVDSVGTILGTPSAGTPTPTSVPGGNVIYVSTRDNNLLVDSGNSNFRAGRVYRTVTGGGPGNWVDITAGLPNIPINTMVVYGDTSQKVLVVGTNVGIFYATDDFHNPLSWTQFGLTLPNVPIMKLVIDQPQTSIVAFTFGRGAWYSTIPQATFTSLPTVTSTNTLANTPTTTATFTPSFSTLTSVPTTTNTLSPTVTLTITPPNTPTTTATLTPTSTLTFTPSLLPTHGKPTHIPKPTHTPKPNKKTPTTTPVPTLAPPTITTLTPTFVPPTSTP